MYALILEKRNESKSNSIRSVREGQHPRQPRALRNPRKPQKIRSPIYPLKPTMSQKPMPDQESQNITRYCLTKRRSWCLGRREKHPTCASPQYHTSLGSEKRSWWQLTIRFKQSTPMDERPLPMPRMLPSRNETKATEHVRCAYIYLMPRPYRMEDDIRF